MNIISSTIQPTFYPTLNPTLNPVESGGTEGVRFFLEIPCYVFLDHISHHKHCFVAANIGYSYAQPDLEPYAQPDFESYAITHTEP